MAFAASVTIAWLLIDGERANAQKGVPYEVLAKKYVEYGLEKEKEGKAEAAIEYYSKAIKYDPKNGDAVQFRGHLYLSRGEFKLAIADFSKAIELDPKRWDSWAMRGLAYGELGEQDKAVADYGQAIKLAPKEESLYVRRGEIYVQQGAYAKARDDFMTAVQLDGKSYGALDALAWLLATCPEDKIRNGDKAVEYARKAYENKEDNNCLQTLAAAYAEVGDYQKAVEWQKKALADPRLQEDKEASRRAELRLKLYESGKPYRSPRPKAP
jgi:tetratricopeptide (TPR) repeat protein